MSKRSMSSELDDLFIGKCHALISGKSEVSSVVYKVGEWMQELLKLWKEYEASQADKSSDSSSNGPTLEVRIPAEHVTATNRQVRMLVHVSLKPLRPSNTQTHTIYFVFRL